MLRYLIQDLTQALKYVPFLLIISGCLVLIVKWINDRRSRKKKEKIPFWSTVCFFSFLALMLMITYLSRESGGTTKLDLVLGSSLTINERNDALVLENLLLFVPYGFCFCWWAKGKGLFIRSIFLGAVTSIAIEWMQLITGRGIFQLDDIVANTIGCMVGAFVYFLLHKLFKR
jgi:glycopeptide antibiotics resistance protein